MNSVESWGLWLHDNVPVCWAESSSSASLELWRALCSGLEMMWGKRLSPGIPLEEDWMVGVAVSTDKCAQLTKYKCKSQACAVKLLLPRLGTYATGSWHGPASWMNTSYAGLRILNCHKNQENVTEHWTARVCVKIHYASSKLKKPY